jgi:formamidopyrimidine-DNA glycosylase
MPELPEVESVRQTLTPQIVGRFVAKAVVDIGKLAKPDPRTFARGLQGRRVRASRRQGKLIIMELDDDRFWTIHLGMTGQLIMAPDRPEASHVHIRVDFDDQGYSLFYRDVRCFGTMGFWRDQAALLAGPLARMGPDALHMSDDVFVERLTKRQAPLKAVLLNQLLLAGVGNIYADEALHRARLSPLARPAELPAKDLARLNQCLQEILTEALAQGGSSVRNFVDAHGRPGTFQEVHRVYQRVGLPCPACGAAVQKIVLASRSTHFCPECQK